MRNRRRSIFNHVNLGARIPRYLSTAVLSSMQKPEISSLARDNSFTSGSCSGRILVSACMQRPKPWAAAQGPTYVFQRQAALFYWDLCKHRSSISGYATAISTMKASSMSSSSVPKETKSRMRRRWHAWRVVSIDCEKSEDQ